MKLHRRRPRRLFCESHGAQRWNGEIVCEACSRLFTTHDPKLSSHAPEMCVCGLRLMPVARWPAVDFSGRPCCSACYATRTTPPAPPAVLPS